MSNIFSENSNLKNAPGEVPPSPMNLPQKKERKYSSNSSDSDSYISNINEEIKIIMENDDNLSFSSKSEDDSQIKNNEIDYLLESKFWKAEKNNDNDNEYNKEKNIMALKKFKKENEKNGKNNGDESYKQSTQGNEDEETRIEHLHNISSTESNNSPLNSLNNNESSENENNYEKLPVDQ